MNLGSIGRRMGAVALLLAVLAVGAGLAAWKYRAMRQAGAAAAGHPEPAEVVTVAVAVEREFQRTTTTVGTVFALRSITLRNELPGTVKQVALTPGQIVEQDTVLVALDVSVEEAELKAQEAQAMLAESTFARTKRLNETQTVPETELDRAVAERDVALAQIARTKAVIARKTIRAPFRARIGLSNVHPGQFLTEGTELTTLQGVDDAADVDFTVTQQVAAGLREGGVVEVLRAGSGSPLAAKIVALDSRVDIATRNAMVRARITGTEELPSPGASVRVRVPVGPPRTAVAIPVNALRKGPAGDHVFVIGPGQDGKTRAQVRPVQSGTMLGDEVLIYSGLSPGEQVAASGSFKLRDAALVTSISNPAPQASIAGQ